MQNAGRGILTLLLASWETLLLAGSETLPVCEYASLQDEDENASSKLDFKVSLSKFYGLGCWKPCLNLCHYHDSDEGSSCPSRSEVNTGGVRM